MGGGDVKLLAASAVWFGINPSLFEYMVYVSLFGGLLVSVLVCVVLPDRQRADRRARFSVRSPRGGKRLAF